jgi:hypothetical protein
LVPRQWISDEDRLVIHQRVKNGKEKKSDVAKDYQCSAENIRLIVLKIEKQIAAGETADAAVEGAPKRTAALGEDSSAGPFVAAGPAWELEQPEAPALGAAEAPADARSWELPASAQLPSFAADADGWEAPEPPVLGAEGAEDSDLSMLQSTAGPPRQAQAETHDAVQLAGAESVEPAVDFIAVEDGQASPAEFPARWLTDRETTAALAGIKVEPLTEAAAPTPRKAVVTAPVAEEQTKPLAGAKAPSKASASPSVREVRPALRGGSNSRKAEGGFGLVLISPEGDQSIVPYNDMNSLLSNLRTIVQNAVRQARGQEVHFSIRSLSADDMAELRGSEAA